MIMTALITIVAAYLLGSINFAVIFAKIFLKKDVRELGSGNAGATNVLRNAGILPGLLTFLCDALKGFASSFLGLKMFEYISHYESGDWARGIYGALICGLACMIGHVFPIFFGFKGGKGVATSVGIFAVCNPLAIAIGVTVFAIVLAITKIVSVSSLIATVVVVILSIAFGEYVYADILPQAIIIFCMAAIIFLKHSSNIKRLLSGTESKIGKKGK